VAGSADAAAPPDADVASGERLEIGLEHARWRHLSWVIAGIIGGAILIWKMGTVAQWVGVGLIGLGIWSAIGFVRTMLFEAGTIVVDGAKVVLPRGVCRGKPDEIDRTSVKHAYLLRRAVPWTRAAPVLVIEAGDRAYLFPRDWFATEADQRRVIHALAQVRYGEVREPEPTEPKPPRRRAL
jgi:hypothetical protein